MDPKQLHKWFIQNRNQIKVLGEVSDGQGKIPIGIFQDQRVEGLWLLGKSGTGKSQIMRQMALEDIAEGRCVIFLDPHGNQIEAITPEVLDKDSDRLLYLNAQHLRNVLGLPTKEEMKNLIRAQQILLVDLQIGKLGAEKVTTYATALLQRIYTAAQELFNNRKDVYLYLDDAHLFQKEILEDLLSHSTQLHLNITLAHQSISQIDPNMLELFKARLKNRLWFDMDQVNQDWIGENFGKQLAKNISDMQGLQFIVDTEVEVGRRITAKAAPAL